MQGEYWAQMTGLRLNKKKLARLIQLASSCAAGQLGLAWGSAEEELFKLTVVFMAYH
jgi:hypothetical protein